MSPSSDVDKSEFEKLVRSEFDFLIEQRGMRFGKVREIEGDPRDAGLVARYSRSDLWCQIAWSSLELSLTIQIRYQNPELVQGERHVYFEPFIEYLTAGKVAALVPYFTPRGSQLERVMRSRRTLFEQGLPSVLSSLAARLQNHFGLVESATPDQIRGFLQWFENQ